MRFNPVLISCFSFASAVLANARQPQQLNLPERSPVSPALADSPRWGGAAWTLDPAAGIFNSVHAVFTVPNVAVVNGVDSFADVLVVIDGSTADGGSIADCPHEVMLGLGINLHASLDGSTHIEAVILNTTGRRSYAPETIDIPISPGDSIQLDINTYDTTTGHVSIENLTNNHTASREVKLRDPLCGQSAGWFVSDVMDNENGYYTLANYGTVIFTDASAGTQGGVSYQPYEATLVRSVGVEETGEGNDYKMSSTMVSSDGPLWITYINYQRFQ